MNKDKSQLTLYLKQQIPNDYIKSACWHCSRLPQGREL